VRSEGPGGYGKECRDRAQEHKGPVHAVKMAVRGRSRESGTGERESGTCEGKVPTQS
jgi:hypothetical protein